VNTPEFSPLLTEIRKLIKSSGPMPVWRYMQMCLMHPQHGYYVSRDPLGARAISPPRPKSARCSASCSACGRLRCGGRSGQPPLLRLIELGPGRGTMMADALRALRVLPPLYQSLTIHMVEVNPGIARQSSARRCRACATSPGTTPSTTSSTARR
jgi:SAM-dependent MidA family methyltransferase